MDYIEIFRFFVSVLLLTAGSALFIQAVLPTAAKLHISKTLISLAIVAIAGVVPELFLTVYSGYYNLPQIALGAALGSGIVGVTLMPGLLALFNRKIHVGEFVLKNDYFNLTLAIIIIFVLTIDRTLSRMDGLILLLYYFYFIGSLSKEKYKPIEKIKTIKAEIPVMMLVMLLSAFGMFLISDFVVLSINNIAKATSVTTFVISLIFIAPLGLIPELMYEFNLAKKKLSGITLAEIFSSVITNLVLITGLISLIKPFAIQEGQIFNLSIFALALFFVMHYFFVRSNKELSWKEGLILIFSYVIFLFTVFLIQLYNNAA